MALAQKRSLIWEYFDIFEEDKKLAVCSVCKKKFSRGGEGKKAGTTALTNHLKNKHPKQFATISAGFSKTKINTKTTLQASGSLSVLPRERIIPRDALERKLVWDSNDAKSKSYHYAIAEMIVLDNEPISTVERIGFTRLMKKAVPQYKMPNRSYISEKIIPDIYERIYTKIKTKILQAVAVSVTSDSWTCLQNKLDFLIFTAHWLSPELGLKHGVLSIKLFTDSHAEKNIGEELNGIVERWEIPQNKIHLLVHNSDMMKGSQGAEFDSVRCFINILQRAIDESMKFQPEVIEMVNDARRIIAYFRNSGVAQRKLKAIRQELNLPEHQLVQDISSRWISTYYLMERLLEQKRAVSVYVTDNDSLINLSKSQWDLMEQCVKLLKPFEEISKVTSAGLSCISEVIPHISTLIKYLEKEATAIRTPNLSKMRSSLRSQLQKCFDNENYDKYIVATFLDPRFKTNFLEVAQAEKAKYIILLSALKMNCHEINIANDFSPPANKIYGDKDIKIEKQDSFWNCFDEIASDNSQNENSEKSSIESEIEYYLKTVRIDRTADPYNWWSENAKQYPILTNFVKIFLSSPSSSIYDETIFSEPGLVYEEKRNRLLTKNAEKLIFIRHNLPLVDFNY